jgi:hypothetical protein
VPRLLLICRHPYHLHRGDAEAWLRNEVETAVRRDELRGARLTRLRSPSSESTITADWLVEFGLDTGAHSRALGRNGAVRELVSDLRLLGMEPMVVLADDCDAIELRPS